MGDVVPKHFARGLLSLLAVAAVLVGSVIMVAFIIPFPTELWRNFTGFIIVPVVLVGAIMGAIVFNLKKPLRSSRAIVACILVVSVLVAFGGFAVWFLGGMFQTPFVYTFTQLHIRNAKAWDGSSVSGVLGLNITDLTTDDYIADLNLEYSTITFFRMVQQGRLVGYYFAYDTKSNVLVPLSEKAASDFPALMPAGDRLENWSTLIGQPGGGQFGDATLAMPANWFHKIDSREHPSR